LSNKSGVSEQIISLPKGGGALQGLGEKFSPDLFTGTGNFTIPLALPAGRNGFQPQLNLVYSTGNGNGPFGLGWNLSIPGVSRKTSDGVPRYRDYDVELKERDTFILSGSEDLVPMSQPSAGVTRYRPHTEGLFAHIDHHHGKGENFWEVRSKDGLVSYYGSPPAGDPLTASPAAIADPAQQGHIFCWKLALTEDPFGNRIEYEYQRDSFQAGQVEENPHEWDQLYLKQIRYGDYIDQQGTRRYLVTVNFIYQEFVDQTNPGQIDRRDLRPDRFSDYRAGFEIRTRLLCKGIVIKTNPSVEHLARHYNLDENDPTLKDHILVRAYEFIYHQDPLNGVSLLEAVEVIGYDDAGSAVKTLPPITFGYTKFEPEKRCFDPVTGDQLPALSLANPSLELADLTGDGLPDILEMNGAVRYWRNRGSARFDLPRMMRFAPPLTLADPGVQLIDADGDGRIDLLANLNGTSGYFPLEFNGEWDSRSMRRFQVAPSFSLEDPQVSLVDLDGDGVTDVIRSGTRLECFFNDSERGWTAEKTRQVARQHLDVFPSVDFSDPRVKWGDMTGDNLQDIVLVYDGNIEYWPSLGHGNWGKRIHMRNSPRFFDQGYLLGYDPRRVLIGDVDGDGLSDIVYVDDRKVTLWINQNGNSWSEPIEIAGTPPVTDIDAVRLVDLLGNGVGGVLWSADYNGNGRPHMFFLDFTGGVKPYLLNEMDNHLGATTKVEYRPSTHFYLEDQARRQPWRTNLPFPIQVVARVEMIDHLSQGKLTSEYRYHHGYWDGPKREFRGFAMVEQLDTETFTRFNTAGLHGDSPFERVDDDPSFGRERQQFFSPPTLARIWFHLGPVGPQFGDWLADLDLSDTFWGGDPPLLDPWEHVNQFLANDLAGGNPRQRLARRDALRSLRGSILRTELYALDRYPDQDRLDPRLDRPYTVSESQTALIEIDPPPAGQSDRSRIFFPHLVAQRTTQWERGVEPMTQFTFTGDYDAYGQPHSQTSLAVPRGRNPLETIPTADPIPQPYFATHAVTDYTQPTADPLFIVDRVARVTIYEILNDGRAAALDMQRSIKTYSLDDPSNIISQTINYYDGAAFTALPYGQIGQYGVLVRSEQLVLTENLLQKSYGQQAPPYLNSAGVTWNNDYPAGFRASLRQLAGYHYYNGLSQPEHTRGYYVVAQREFDFQRAAGGRGLLFTQRDPLNNAAHIEYETQLLPVRVIDAVGLVTSAQYNYRVLQPDLVTDQNGNRRAVAYSPLGLPLSISIMGKAGAQEGDRRSEPSGGQPAVDYPSTRFEYNFRAYYNSPADDRQSVFVRILRRQDHFWDIVAAENERRRANGLPDLTETEIDTLFPGNEETAFNERFIEQREFSDGFGRLLQTRTQAEEERFGDAVLGNEVLPLAQGGSLDRDPLIGSENHSLLTPNVVVSGWQTYDNKGRVIEKYEPYFDVGWDYVQPAAPQGGLPLGVKAILFYDPRGQVIRTVNPDGSEQRVIYGVPGTIANPDVTTLAADGSILFEPTPWEAYTYDANDLAPLSRGPDDSGLDSRAPQSHHFTPSNIEIDALGRTVRAVQRLAQRVDFVTRATYDIRGNLLSVTDALNRQAFSYEYDLANRPLRSESIDAGLRMSILDAAGNTIERRDSKGALELNAYDPLNRPDFAWARDGNGLPVTLRQRLTYGDDTARTGLSRAQALDRNLLGQPYRHYDEAGLLQFDRFDFRGNLVEKSRRTIQDTSLVNNWQPDWDAPGSTNALEPLNRAYRVSSSFDALNRPQAVTYPADVNNHRAVLRSTFNRGGALERIELDGEIYVERIAYNARGQRTLIAYGNGVLTRYAYDSNTFRLSRLRTEGYTANALQYQPSNAVYQDFAYEYDLAGNLTRLTDRAPGNGVRNNPQAALYPELATELVAGNALVRRFDYDPLYRLAEATGRQGNHQAASCTSYDQRREGFNWSGNPPARSPANARDLTQVYTERFTYDPAGNLLRLSRTGHSTRYSGMSGFTPRQWEDKVDDFLAGGAPDWGSEGNRLTNFGARDQGQTHRFDLNGNLIQENTSRQFAWDHADRLVLFTSQASSSCPTSVEARYLYDAVGFRVKKWVRTNGTGPGESVTYIDGLFEHHRWVQLGQPGLRQNNHLHLMDNQSRVAVIRIGDLHPDDSSPEVKFHLSDHLGSSFVVIGGADASTKNFINLEEYYPFGETSFGSFGKKRYRFTGKERDEESKLNYHHARYYAPWLGRWISPDPAGLNDGIHNYRYCQNRPLINKDPTGMAAEPQNSTNKIQIHNFTDPIIIVGERDAEIKTAMAAERDARKWGDLETAREFNLIWRSRLTERMQESQKFGTIALGAVAAAPIVIVFGIKTAPALARLAWPLFKSTYLSPRGITSMVLSGATNVTKQSDALAKGVEKGGQDTFNASALAWDIIFAPIGGKVAAGIFKRWPVFGSNSIVPLAGSKWIDSARLLAVLKSVNLGNLVKAEAAFAVYGSGVSALRAAITDTSLVENERKFAAGFIFAAGQGLGQEFLLRAAPSLFPGGREGATYTIVGYGLGQLRGWFFAPPTVQNDVTPPNPANPEK
jgi:RHS repeat-associated protein